MTKEEVLLASALLLCTSKADYQFQEEQVVRSLVCHQPAFIWYTKLKFSMTAPEILGQFWKPAWGLSGQHTKFVRQIFHYHYAGKCKEGMLCASNIYTFGRTLEGMKFQVGVCLN